MIWSERWAPQNLLRTESGSIKVGFVVQKLHGSEILKMQNFALGARVRALSYIFPALPWAARYALASSCGRIWFVETIPSLYRGSYKQSFLSPGRRSEMLDDKKKSRVMTRFGP